MVKNTMKPMIKCVKCRRIFPANPRVKSQKYCNRKACQRVRKNKWKQRKIATDADYKKDQRDYHKKWIAQHPGYYRNYRKQNPGYCDRNRKLQRKRDTLKQILAIKPGSYGLIPLSRKRA